MQYPQELIEAERLANIASQYVQDVLQEIATLECSLDQARRKLNHAQDTLEQRANDLERISDSVAATISKG